jgi:hypothetical protein
MRAEVLRIDPAAGPGFAAFMAEEDLFHALGFEAVGAPSFDGVGGLFMAIPSMVMG